MNFDESRSKIPIPLPPLRNSSARKGQIHSFILPVSPDEEFSQATINSSNFYQEQNFYHQERNDNFYQDVSYNSSIITPLTPPYPPYSPVIPPILSNSISNSRYSCDVQVAPTQAYRFRRDNRVSQYEGEENFTAVPKCANGFTNHSSFTPILPAIPPKIKSLKSSLQTPVAKPRRKRPDTPNTLSTVHTQNTAPAGFRPMPLPQNHRAAITPNYPRITPSTGLSQPPDLPPKSRHTTELILPMVPPRPPRGKSHQLSAFHPYNY